MKTPVQILADELERSGIEKTELGRRLGSKSPYLFVRDILTGRKAFDERLQAKVADVLGKPRNFFSDPSANAAREKFIRDVFFAFARTEIGASLDPDTLRSIERIPFFGERLPTVALYQAVALAMRGDLSVEAALAAVPLNESLDAEKPPTPKRRK